ncbi:hypothetical protein WME95_45500 [Sorangium sp. So ce327]|uniref:hypothetical protein n=1 Tax=Sorangium sp. So ce327 TaxID=3133301 RepID=UPI003F5EDD5B
MHDLVDRAVGLEPRLKQRRDDLDGYRVGELETPRQEIAARTPDQGVCRESDVVFAVGEKGFGVAGPLIPAIEP